MFTNNRKQFKTISEIKISVFRLAKRYFLSHTHEFNFKRAMPAYRIIMILSDLIYFIYNSRISCTPKEMTYLKKTRVY